MLRTPEPGKTEEQIRRHYEVEVELAEQLLTTSKEQRRILYSALYNELFERVPDHPQLVKKFSLEERREHVSHQVEMLKRFLGASKTFLEVGAGDCALSFAIAPLVKKAIAIDVSKAITDTDTTPDNFELALSDGTSIPVTANSVDLVYSNQLMEHLHPNDALEQLNNIFTAIAPGGCYLCVTPSKVDGPHDVSKYFSQTAKGFHLKEYTIKELKKLFYNAGFKKISMYFGVKQRYLILSTLPFIFIESIMMTIPYKVRQKILKLKFVENIFCIRLISYK